MSLLKRNWGLDWGCIIGEAFCGVLFLVKKDVLKSGAMEIWCWYKGFLAILALQIEGFFKKD